MPFEFLDRPFLVCFLDHGVFGIRIHDVSSFFELQSPFYCGELNFSPYVFRALSPFRLDRFHSQLKHVFRNSEPSVFNVILDHDRAAAIMPFLVALDPPVHFRGFHDPAVLDLAVRVHPADVLAYHHHCAADSRSDRGVLPVYAGHIC